MVQEDARQGAERPRHLRLQGIVSRCIGHVCFKRLGILLSVFLTSVGFISTSIYIASIQENYSEGLSTQLKRRVVFMNIYLCL